MRSLCDLCAISVRSHAISRDAGATRATSMRFRRDLCAISLRRRAGAALVAVRELVGVARLHVGVPGGEVGVELVGQRRDVGAISVRSLRSRRDLDAISVRSRAIWRDLQATRATVLVSESNN